MVEEVSQQQTTIEEMISRVASLEKAYSNLASQQQATMGQMVARVSSLEEAHSEQASQQTTIEKLIARVSSLEEANSEELECKNGDKQKDAEGNPHLPAKVQKSSKHQEGSLYSDSSSIRQSKVLSKKMSKAVKKAKKVRSKSTPPFRDRKLVKQVKVPVVIKEPIVPCPVKMSLNALSTSEIDKSSLISVDDVLHKYKKDVLRNRVSTIGVRLARKAIFGDAVMKRCTPMGRKSYPALPTEPLSLLKSVLFKTFSGSWSKPSDSERAWQRCLKSLERACSELRKIDARSTSGAQDSIIQNPKERLSVVHTTHPLSSSEIIKSELMDIEQFIAKYSTDIENSKYNPATLTRKLAREVVFGREILKKCSITGKRSRYPGLPVAELNLLKQLVFEHSPAYRNRLDEFEKEWSVCKCSLLKQCNRLRSGY